jgi:hypothetical protein
LELSLFSINAACCTQNEASFESPISKITCPFYF